MPGVVDIFRETGRLEMPGRISSKVERPAGRIPFPSGELVFFSKAFSRPSEDRYCAGSSLYSESTDVNASCIYY